MTDDVFHLMVWVDHRIAKLYAITRDGIEETAVIHAPAQGHGHIHHSAGTPGPGHDDISQDFLCKIGIALRGAEEILIVGPAGAKHALKNYLAKKAPLLDKRVLGVESLDKSDTDVLLAFASRFFHRADRMGSQPGS